MAIGIPKFAEFPVATLKDNKFAVLSEKIFLKIGNETKAIKELKRYINIGKASTEELNSRLKAELKTTKGERMYSKIFATLSLLQCRKNVLKKPSIIPKYKGIILYKSVKNILI